MSRFYQGYHWRWVVLAIEDAFNPTFRITSFLDPLALDATVNRVLNEPLTINLTVPSDQVQVYLEDATDGQPLVAEGVRVLVGMRPENPGSSSTWVPRAAGVILQPNDSASAGDGAGVGKTQIQALDSWNLLYRRPCVHVDGSMPDSNYGLRFNAGTAVNDIVTALLANTVVAHGSVFMDLDGTIETLPAIPVAMTFERGLTVGEAWKQLCDANLCDIVLDPILDIDRGFINRLNVYAKAGEAQYDARFVYDGFGRNAASMSREEDGTLRVNKVQEYFGQGGGSIPLLTATGSAARFGESWLMKAQERTTTSQTAQDLAQVDLDQRASGVRTITVTPASERAAIPFTGYDIGDTVTMVSTQQSLRKEVSGLWRVTTIPITLPAGEPERVDSLQVTSDEFPDT